MASIREIAQARSLLVGSDKLSVQVNGPLSATVGSSRSRRKLVGDVRKTARGICLGGAAHEPTSWPTLGEGRSRGGGRGKDSAGKVLALSAPSPRDGGRSSFLTTHSFCVSPLLSFHPLRSLPSDDLPLPAEMTHEDARELLGVGADASFDDILSAKRRKMETLRGEQDQMLRVEAAYDILLMRSLSRRRAGEVVDNSVRFADVQRPKQPSAPPAWLQAVSRTTTLTLAKPSASEVAVRTALFGALAAWTYASGLGATSEPYAQYGTVSSASDVPGLQLALAVGASIYFLRKDNVGLGRATALTFTSLAFGGLLGGFLEAWLRVDIFPLLGISSPAVLIGEFSSLSVLLTCLYLR